MKRIIIIGEGQTEQSFCNDVLQPYFNTKNICIENPVTKKKRGGIVNWQALKYQIERHLLQDPTAYVTTLIDYYGLYGNLDYPEWVEAEKIHDISQRMTFLEAAMLKAIQPHLQHRFVPYIQLHEFEGLLFCDMTVFRQQISSDELTDAEELENIITAHPNPELINNNPSTAPSKRLEKLIYGYTKTVYGPILAAAIGLQKIRSKCPRFNTWITALEQI